MDRARRLNACAVLLAGAVAFPAAAQPAPSDLEDAAGRWDLSLDGANRSCRVMLTLDQSPVGRTLRFPAGCRRALPILNGMGGWTLAEKKRLTLLDAQGAVALQFEREAEDVLVAKAATGEVFRLERPEDMVQPIRLPPPPPPIGVPQMTPVDPATAPPLASLPGTYVVDRYSEREVCRINLGRAMLDAFGRFEARVIDGCRDLGLAAFDPLAWRYEAGRLTLTARRGHEVTLISERDGHWRRDPEVGATLILRKVPAP
jgi:Protease inhibitor Inh